MFGERLDWYEVLQHCIYCGRPFMADYKYHDVCHECYIAKWGDENNDKKDMGGPEGDRGVGGVSTPDSNSSV